ncbi:MAG: hypothetical protein DPW18_01825 [Chloroflexi bacterium]|nr:hypothetical protein [Chloroflexota bacterium]MDL1944486.1 lysoplasmalogenase [Chloroflexi bacterium CFX2]
MIAGETMWYFSIAALLFAALESLALWKNWKRLETIVKPAVMVVLFAGLSVSAGLEGALFWFGLGILFSLTGDVLLMLSLDRFFLAGLTAFLLAHLAYVIGFNIPLPGLTSWGLILAVMIGWGGVRVINRILSALAAKGQNRLRLPVIVYSAVISLMLLSAMIKLPDLTWGAGASLLVSLGALLFYLSDVVLAWNKFVTPIQHGRIYNIAAYHLGQIAIVTGAALQFGK